MKRALPKHRLALLDNVTLASNGFNWAEVYLLRDTETGAEFIVTYGKDGNVRVTALAIRPEVAR